MPLNNIVCAFESNDVLLLKLCLVECIGYIGHTILIKSDNMPCNLFGLVSYFPPEQVTLCNHELNTNSVELGNMQVGQAKTMPWAQFSTIEHS